MHRALLRPLAFCAVLTACYEAGPSDAGTIDGGAPEDAAFDASADAGADAPGTDAPGTDAPGTDAGTDAADARRDAGPDVTAAVDAALDLICGVPAYASCTAPWACGCETSGAAPPDVDACVRLRQSACEPDHRDRLAAFFARSGVTVDDAALATCIETARRSYDLCLPNPVIDEDLPASCWDAFVLGLPSGAACDYSGVRCADGAGVCAGRSCTPAGASVGARCSGACAGGLSCVEGRCAVPVAAAAACADHEDCAPTELCVGGACAPPVAPGASCDGRDRCTTGWICEGGTCRSPGSLVCAVGGADTCPAGTECRSSFRNVCQPRRELGAECNGDEECSLDLECDLSSSFPGVCAPVPGAGEACRVRCADGLSCIGDFRGEASCRPLLRLGDACVGLSSATGRVCEGGLGCSGGTCNPLPRLDEPCSDEGLCEAGLACVFDASVFMQLCRPAVEEGDDCGRTGGGCADGLFCDFGSFPTLCRAIPGEGQECPGGVCTSGLECRYFAPLDRSICVLPASLGDECQSLCAGDAYCAPDPSAGACFTRVCDRVSTGGGPDPVPL